MLQYVSKWEGDKINSKRENFYNNFLTPFPLIACDYKKTENLLAPHLQNIKQFKASSFLGNLVSSLFHATIHYHSTSTTKVHVNSMHFSLCVSAHL